MGNLKNTSPSLKLYQVVLGSISLEKETLGDDFEFSTTKVLAPDCETAVHKVKRRDTKYLHFYTREVILVSTIDTI